MKIIVDSKENVAKIAAEQYVSLLEVIPDAVLGLATGSSPEGLYAELIKLYKEGKISFKDVTTFNLDEYIGLPEGHSQSYKYFMDDKLFNHVDINKENVHIPSGSSTSEDDCLAYEREIARAGGIDLQLLGIGVNGHIAFNEPGTPFGSLTHVVELTPTTREVNSRFFDSLDEVPTHATCMGIRSIMNARELLLVATGQNKADAIRNTVYGRISKKCPASILQLHPSVTVLLDEEAASKL